MRIILILAMVLFPFSALAADYFLVCDPYDASYGIQGFKGTYNGVAFETKSYALHSSGKAIVYGLGASLPTGSLDFKNLRAYNTRGEGSGVDYFYPAAPPSLTGIGIVSTP